MKGSEREPKASPSLFSTNMFDLYEGLRESQRPLPAFSVRICLTYMKGSEREPKTSPSLFSTNMFVLVYSFVVLLLKSKRMHCTELQADCVLLFHQVPSSSRGKQQAYVASECQVGKWTQPLYKQKSSKAESGARANCRPNCNYIRWQIFEYHAHLGVLASPQGSLCLLAAHAVFET